MSKKQVIIVGGGVAGLSAAHELAKFPRDFEVHVLEAKTVQRTGKLEAQLGGKASSYTVPGVDEKHHIAEHGFHMFPSFYRHVTQTMKEIPYTPSDAHIQNVDESVWGNLQGCTEVAYAQDGDFRKVERPLPESGLDFVSAVRKAVGDGEGVTEGDIAIYAWLLLKFVTSCKERRDEEYDQMTWREYFRIDQGLFSDAFLALITTLPRTLSAMRTDQCSARTVCSTSIQLLFDMTDDGGVHMESMLRGPLWEMWFEPWVKLLEKKTKPSAAAQSDSPKGHVTFWPGVTLQALSLTESTSRG